MQLSSSCLLFLLLLTTTTTTISHASTPPSTPSSTSSLSSAVLDSDTATTTAPVEVDPSSSSSTSSAEGVIIVNAKGKLLRQNLPLKTRRPILAVIGLPSNTDNDNNNNDEDGSLIYVPTNEAYDMVQLSIVVNSEDSTSSDSSYYNDDGSLFASPIATGACASSGTVLILSTSSSTTTTLELADAYNGGKLLTETFRGEIAARSNSATDDNIDEEEDDDTQQRIPLTIVVSSTFEGDVRNVASVLFDAVVMEDGLSLSNLELEDVYDLDIIVDNIDEAMQSTATKMLANTNPPTRPSLSSSHNILSHESTTSSDLFCSNLSPTIAAATYACDESFSRHRRSARAKISQWRLRTIRNLPVDSFGKSASKVVRRAIDSYDRDTADVSVMVSSEASMHRLEARERLVRVLSNEVSKVLEGQVQVLRERGMKRFKAILLRSYDSSTGTGSPKRGAEGRDRSAELAMVDSAVSAFAIAAESLRVRALNLDAEPNVVTTFRDDVTVELDNFPDSPAMRLRALKMTKVEAEKEIKKPKEDVGINVGLDLVAMLRPDGFGNLQGFVGYEHPWLIPLKITAGIHNDADDPATITQFGGMRPPLLRIQPQLKVNIER